MKRIRPFGSWTSSLDSRALVAGARILGLPRIAQDALYWLERRPAEGGRQVVMRCELAPLRRAGATAVEGLREVSPADGMVRSRVHEYGGGEYTVWRDRLFYVDDADRRVHGGPLGGPMRPLTPPGSCYAEPVVSGDGRWLVAVEERPVEDREPENRLVAVPLDVGTGRGEAIGAGPAQVVAAGHDFYASPVFDPATRRLAYLAWDHPHVPWQESVLEQVAWNADGAAGSPRRLAGRPGESLFQPGFAPDGTLYVVSDRSGHWNLMRVGDAGLEAVHALRGELGRPQWVFGLSTWAFLDDRRILASVTRDGRDALVEIALASGEARPWPSAFVTIGGLAVGDGVAAFVAGSPEQGLALYAGPCEAGGARLVRDGGAPILEDFATSVAEAVEIALPHGRSTHAYLYAPTSGDFEGGSGERPPLLVKSHGGPTSATSSAYDPRIQFWTSRGFLVADVDYAGSSGYGRAYRDLLERRWGEIDVEDCVGVARWLAAEGRVDPARLAITGGSAGGFTTLCALTFHDVFRAGASHYGIGDLEALVRDTHKFESHYTDWLVGPWPEERARYRERSPIHHAERLHCPVIFFQGLEDRVVPPNQSETMVQVLASRGIAHAYVPFAGEGHGFRRAENIRTALDGELYFYGRVFGFEAPRPAAVEWVGPRR